MANDKRHRIDKEAYQRYLDGTMTPVERHAFEKTLLDDPFAREALEGMESMDPGHVKDDLKTLEIQLARHTQKKKVQPYWRIAAGLLLLGIFSFVIYYFIDTGSPTEIAQDKSALSEKVDIKDTTQTEADAALEEKPEQIIAYQQQIDKVDTENTRTSAAPVETEEQKAAETSEEIAVRLDMVAPEEVAASKVADEEIIENIAEPQAAAPEPTVTTEMKKAEASPAQKRKTQYAEQREVAGAVATVSAERTISGRVTSADDDSPLPGVNVIIKGSATGAITDIDGNFEISISSGSSPTLVFNSIGYVSEEVEVSGESRMDVSLNSDVTALSEIVVTGYGVSSERNNNYSYTPPKPTGGQSKFNDYLKANLRYPASGLESGVKGSVRIQFTVTAAGSLTNIRVIRSLGEDFDKEALRLIQEGPAWEAAEENGSRVPRDVKITIRFKPPE